MIYLKRIALIILLMIFCQTIIAQNETSLEAHLKGPEIALTPGCTTPTGALSLSCYGSTTTSASFDFNNAGQSQFQYSYTIDNGPPITGVHYSPSNFNVTGLTSGQSVAFTLTWVGLCGSNTKTITCTALCTSTTTPNFAPIPDICSGSTAPILQNTSPNGVTGTWSPAIINNLSSGTYTFTPNSICSSPQTISVNVLPKVTPTFTPLQPVCQNAPAPLLPQSSTNVPPITGTWSPAVSTSIVGTRTYTFTPHAGQCTVSTPTTLTLTVGSNQTPGFASIPPFCSGATPPLLSTTSPTGVTGTWSPATINPTTSGSYVFTPHPNQCANSQTLVTSVSPSPVPTFASIAPFCAGSLAPVLPSVSLQNITGTWSPPLVDNAASSVYQFIPDPGQCAAPTSVSITVLNPLNPDFPNLMLCSGTAVPTLPAVSPNGINGTWSPAIVDGLTSGSYTFTPNEGECAIPQTIQSVINEATLSTIDYTVSNAFNDDQIITVLTSTSGNYLYQLDFGPLYTTNVFHNVSPGFHTVTVYDANGCSDPVTIIDILVINYPHYFTPNADGTNDFWKISGLSPESEVLIFDRYGKVITQIGTEGNGWDGTFLGTPAPSSDYWFRVNYRENNQSKQFMSHFTLKR